MVLRLPPVYMVKAEIEINPPEIDPMAFDAAVATEIGRRDPASQANYVANREVRLRSRTLAERVVPTTRRSRRRSASTPIRHSSSFRVAQRHAGQEKRQLVHRLSRRQRPGTDQESCLEILLKSSRNRQSRKTTTDWRRPKTTPNETCRSSRPVWTTSTPRSARRCRRLAPSAPAAEASSKNEYINLGTMMSQKQMRLSEIHQQMLVSQMFPKFELDGAAGAREARLAQLKLDKRKYERILETDEANHPQLNQDDPAAIECVQNA